MNGNFENEQKLFYRLKATVGIVFIDVELYLLPFYYVISWEALESSIMS